MGINLHRKIGKKLTVNSFNYAIDERFDGLDEQVDYSNAFHTTNRRIFTVDNLRYYSDMGVLTANLGIDYSEQGYDYAALSSKDKANQMYASVNYKWFIAHGFDLQFGLTYDYQHHEFNGAVPAYRYDPPPTSSDLTFQGQLANHNLETYMYQRWDVGDQ